MDEIDQAIADFEAAQAARGTLMAPNAALSKVFGEVQNLSDLFSPLVGRLAAKKNQKKRGNATLETEVAVTPAPDQDTQSESNDEVAQPPPLKKQKLNKKAQKRAFNAIYASQVRTQFSMLLIRRCKLKLIELTRKGIPV